MAMKAFHIELRLTNVDDPERLLAVRRALQAAGRQLHASAMLICKGEDRDNDPEIILYGEDFAQGRDDIAASDPEPEPEAALKQKKGRK